MEPKEPYNAKPTASVRIECSRTELQTALRHLRLGVPKRRKGQGPLSFEINIRPGNAVLSTLGASYTISCKANCFAKVIAPFAIISDFAKRWKGARVEIGVEVGRLEFGGSVFESPSIHVVHPENQPTIDLTLNYTDRDLINLRDKHAGEELERMNLMDRIEKAEERMRERVNNAYDLLKMYGVTYDDLERIVNSRLKG